MPTFCVIPVIFGNATTRKRCGPNSFKYYAPTQSVRTGAAARGRRLPAHASPARGRGAGHRAVRNRCARKRFRAHFIAIFHWLTSG
ncbi:hypothetical protein CO709_04375 [Burkholderia thailandensis]|nr:hypothetical protein CO709_04375 [Burkholderia thailandensis]